MARFASFVAAEGIAIDQLSGGRVTAFNMVEAVVVAALPTMLIRMSVASLYELSEPEQFTERVQVISPAGHVVSESQSQLAFVERVPHQLPNAHRSIHSLWRIALEQLGDYRVVLSKRYEANGEWEELASICVTVAVQPNAIMNLAPMTVPPVPPSAPRPEE